MSLEKLEPCCTCVHHQRIFRNEDGWVLTQDFEAWTAQEWSQHCARFANRATYETRRDEIVARLVAGDAVNEIADAYGLTPDTIRRYRRRFVERAA